MAQWIGSYSSEQQIYGNIDNGDCICEKDSYVYVNFNFNEA